MRPSATLPMGRHPTLPLATISLSFPPLDGEDYPATETIPEITLEDRQAQTCCQHRNALVSCIDADARLPRKKTLRRECHAQVRACLTALPCYPTPPEPRFRTDRDRQRHFHAQKLPWPHAQPVIDKDDVLAAAPPYLPLRQQDVIHAFLDHVRNIGDDMHKCTPCLGRYHSMTLHDTLCARCHNEVRSPFSLVHALTDIHMATVHRTANIAKTPQTTPTLARPRQNST